MTAQKGKTLKAASLVQALKSFFRIVRGLTVSLVAAPGAAGISLSRSLLGVVLVLAAPVACVPPSPNHCTSMREADADAAPKHPNISSIKAFVSRTLLS